MADYSTTRRLISPHTTCLQPLVHVQVTEEDEEQEWRRYNQVKEKIGWRRGHYVFLPIVMYS